MKTVAKAVDLLYWFAANPQPVRFTEVCRGTRFGKAVVHRLLMTLEYKRLVVRDGQEGAYSLGPGIGALAASLFHRGDLVSQSHPTMRALWMQFQETITLIVRSGFERFCIYQLESPRSLRYALPLGGAYPLYCGAAGKLLLAMMADEEIAQYLAQVRLVRLGPNTPVDPERVWEHVRKIRVKGYAVTTEETALGVTGIAAPIFGVGDRCVASLGLFAPKALMPARRVREATEAMVVGARAISSALGAAENCSAGVIRASSRQAARPETAVM